MKYAVAVLLFASALAGSPAPAAANSCGENVRLSVDPADRIGDVAATLRRRLAAAEAKPPQVETDGPAALKALLPAGVRDSLLTRPARIEFRLVAAAPNTAGAVALPRLDGKGLESVEPQIIVDEFRMREVTLKREPGADGAPVAAIAFRLEPSAVKNLMTATAEAIGRKLAIIVDDKILADPIIRAPVASVEGEISGLPMDSAAELVGLLPNGRLVAHVAIVSRQPAPCMTH